MKKLIVLGLILLSGKLTFSQTAFTPEIIADLQFVSEVSVSPSGSTIAYLLRVPGQDKTGMMKSMLITVPHGGGVQKTILDKQYSPSSISWGTDGKKIYYVGKDTVSKTAQIYSVDASGGSPSKVSSLPSSVDHYKISPDGKSIALSYTDPQTDKEKENEKLKRDWVVYDENLKYSRLHVMSISGENPKKLFDANLHVTSLTWTPDNSTIVFMAAEKTSTDHTMMFQKIYRVPAAGGTPEVICETDGKLGSMDVSPDGKNLAFCGAVDITDPLAQSVFVVPVLGGDAKNLCENYDGSTNEVKWVGNNSILMLATEGCYSAMKKIDAKSGKHTSWYEKGAIIRGWHVSKNGNLAVSASTPKHPNEVFAGSATAKGLRKLTSSNEDLSKIVLAKQEVISWTGPDNWKIEGVLTYPIDYKAGTKYPLLLQLHGGPEGVSTHGWNTRAVYPVQYYAASGYFVLEPNYRGSMGHGVKFAKGDHKDLGGKEFEDVLAGIDHLIAKGMVDGDKVGTGGFSYGGYFSAWAATKHSARFKAAVMGAGISDWISFTNTTDIIHENSEVHWNCWWYDQPELYWDRSPLAHINKAKTPTLVIHGDKDDRVPISQGIEMYNALKTKGVYTQMVVYKRQPHGILEREAMMDYMNRTLEWFNLFLKK